MTKIEIRAVEMVRRIRDEQAALLANKSEAEVIDFFRKAGAAAHEDAQKLRPMRGAAGKASNPPLQRPGSAGR
jgi:hypothetical protein